MREWEDDSDFKPEAELFAEALSDGEYTLEIKNAALKEVEKTDDKTGADASYLEIRLSAKILSQGANEGSTLSHGLYIKDKASRNKVGAVLKLLGFDADNWTAAKAMPFTAILPKAVACLPGLRLLAKKRSNKDGAGKTWHNVDILKRAPGDGRAPQISTAEMEAAWKAKEAKDNPF